ncbi:hypothetical protein Tco_1565650, partial [Tanacetum coccineum]
DDPFIKVMQAYFAKESPIPPPTIMPPSPILSPMFNPQEFFLPDELLSPKKQGAIEESLDHLDELSLGRIKHIEDNIEGLGKGQNHLGQNHKIALARFWIADLEQIIKEIQDRHQANKESLLDENQKLKINKESLIPKLRLNDDKLNFVEEPVEIMDREVKQLKQSHIPIIKVRWNSIRGPEFTWEREDQIRVKVSTSIFKHHSDIQLNLWMRFLLREEDYNNPQFSSM